MLSRTARRLAASVAGATLTLGLLPAVASADTDAVCAAAPDQDVDFDDVDENGGTFGPLIACIAGYGLVDGFADNTYRPATQVTRGQAAIFVTNLLETASGEELPVPEENPYEDVDADGVFGDAILKLTEAGIVEGVTATTYGPGQSLTRGQMAQIVATALEFLNLRLDSTDAGFDDVSNGIFADSINALANLGVVEGVDADTYAPGRTVTRGQLAGFEARAAGAADDVELWRPTVVGPFLRVDTTQALTGEDITLTVTFLDAQNQPVEGVTIDVFAADGDDPYEADGTPRYAEGVDVAGGTEPTTTPTDGTGLTQGEIDADDPVTDADGEVVVTVSATADSDVLLVAWTGETGDAFDDGDVPDDERGERLVSFLPTVEELGLEHASPTMTYRFGDDATLTVQLLDVDGDPIARGGQEITFTATEPSGFPIPIPGGDAAEEGSVSTNNDGVATVAVPAAEDPNPEADSDPITYDVVITHTESGTTVETTVTFDDAEGDEVAEAELSHLSGDQAPYDEDVAATVSGDPHTVRTTLVNTYGEPVAGVAVTFTAGASEFEDTTGADGTAEITFATLAAGEVTISLDETDFASQDTTPTIDELTLSVVDEAVPADTTTTDTIVGIDLGDDQVAVGGDLLQYVYEADDTFTVDGETATLAEFEAALAEAEATSTLSVSLEGTDGTRSYTLATPA